MVLLCSLGRWHVLYVHTSSTRGKNASLSLERFTAASSPPGPRACNWHELSSCSRRGEHSLCFAPALLAPLGSQWVVGNDDDVRAAPPLREQGLL